LAIPRHGLADRLPVAAQGDRDSTKGEIEKMLKRSDVAEEFVPDMRCEHGAMA
jgi:hypothetical protein